MAKQDKDKKTAPIPATTKKSAVKKKAPKKKAEKKTITAKTTTAKKKSTKRVQASTDEKRMMVAMHAYYKWENAGRPDNAETQYWFEAEQEIEAMLK